MKVVYFGFAFLEIGGGFEGYMVDTATSLARMYSDCDITIVTFDDASTRNYFKIASNMMMKKYDNGAIYRESLSSIEDRLGPVKYVKVNSLKMLKSVLQDADVVYTKNELIEMILLHMIGLKRLPPVVVGVHSQIRYPYAPTFGTKIHNLLYNNLFQKILYKKVAAIKVSNKDDYEYFKQKLNIHNVGVLHHAFEYRTKKPFFHESKNLRVLFVGRLVDGKGVDILLDVIKKFEKKDNVHFRIIGSGDESIEESVLDTVKKYSFAEYVGHIPHGNLSKHYDWTDCTIIPSRFETLNKVAVETAIHSKIAISSDIPGPREVIEDQKTGYLIPVTTDAFYDKITELAVIKNTNPDKMKSMGKFAKNKIKTEFSPEISYRSLHGVFSYIKSPK